MAIPNPPSLRWRSSMPLFKVGLFVTFGVLFLNVPGTMSTQVQNIKTLLDQYQMNYISWEKPIAYESSTKYYARGMGPLYNSTHKVLKWFIGDDAIPEDYIIVTEGNIKLGPKVDNNEWGDLAKHYWPILLVIAVCALLAVLMPIIGLCFCCCRCAGACGGRSQPFDKKHDTCRRVFLGLLLICAATGLLFGVVVTFATNSYMQDGVDEVTTTVQHGSSDTQKFLISISEHVNYVLVDNFNLLSANLTLLLKDAAGFVFNGLKDKSKADSFRDLDAFVNNLPTIQRKLSHMKEITNELRVKASQLSDGLRGVKRELLQTLTKCLKKPCKDILEKYEIGKLDASDIDYNKLPDVSEIISSVDQLIKNKVVDVVKNGNNALQNMEQTLNKTIDKQIPDIKASINNAGDEIKKKAAEIVKIFDSFSNTIDNNSDWAIKNADKYIKEYSIYRFYVGIAISSVLLLVLCAITFALFCGICGKRPDGYGDDCCNKGSGSRFLMLAITVIFLTISILAVAALIHFLVGLILYRGVCVPLQNPESDRLFEYLDNYIGLDHILNPNQKANKFGKSTGTMPSLRVSNLIASCHSNQTMYKVLRLSNQMDIADIKEYPKEFNINKTMDKLVESITVNTNITMLSDDDKKILADIGKSKLGAFDSDKFTDNLNDNITKFTLSEIAAQLRETAKNIPASDMPDVTGSLRNQALHLETYQEKLVDPMLENTKDLLKLANTLKKTLTFNNLPFEESIAKMVEDISTAQDVMQKNGSEFLKDTAQQMAAHFTLELNKFLDTVVTAIQSDIGTCGPLSNVYNATVVAGCNKIIDPLNGFWAGLGWSVLIFLPTLIISVKLATLYQKSDPYPGPLVESEYLYDAYSERDNIPLANGPKRKRRKNKERRRGSRDRRGDYHEESGSSHVPTGGAGDGRDTRYNDMAPKHWDGGPPRYTNPPMAPPASEYERPPPYYYPGASDE